MKKQHILTAIADGESQYVEFQTSFQKEMIATIVAFANAKVVESRVVFGKALKNVGRG